MTSSGGGPLAGVRVLEFAGIGPVPFCGMLLSDMGADVLRVDRPGARYDRFMVETRGRRSIELDLKDPRGRNAALELAARADILLEGFRPGVMERLDLGPDAALARNAKLVYARMTGWGQEGPYAARAGHDINYIAVTGALHAIGPADSPIPPLNLVGDFGGGALYLAVGALAALRHAERSGEGQVVDCAMSDGAASLMAMMYGYLARGEWFDRRGANTVDGAAPFYRTFRCADGAFLCFGAIEPQFYSRLREAAGLTDAVFDDQWNRDRWPEMRERLGAVVAQRTRAEWIAHFGDVDACVSPVLSLAEAPGDTHNVARQVFIEVDGVTQPAPAPRFLRTPGAVQGPPVPAGDGGWEAVGAWGAESAVATALAEAFDG